MKYIRLIIMFVSAIMMIYELNAVFQNPDADLSSIKTFQRAGIFFLIILLGLYGFWKDKKRIEQMNRYKDEDDL